MLLLENSLKEYEKTVFGGLSRNGKYFFQSAQSKRKINIVYTESGRLIDTIEKIAYPSEFVTNLDDSILYVSTTEDIIYVYDLINMCMVKKFKFRLSEKYADQEIISLWYIKDDILMANIMSTGRNAFYLIDVKSENYDLIFEDEKCLMDYKVYFYGATDVIYVSSMEKKDSISFNSKFGINLRFEFVTPLKKNYNILWISKNKKYIVENVFNIIKKNKTIIYRNGEIFIEICADINQMKYIEDADAFIFGGEYTGFSYIGKIYGNEFEYYPINIEGVWDVIGFDNGKKLLILSYEKSCILNLEEIFDKK